MTARGETASVYGDFEEDFSCAICSEIFNNEERTPKLLPCHHSFCSQCLYKCAAKDLDKKFDSDLKDKEKEFKCPLCKRNVSLLPADVMEFQDNFYLINIMDKLVKASMDVTKKTTKKQNEEQEPHICKNHEMEVVHICETCNVYLCGKCLVLSIAEHSKHKVSVLKDPFGEREATVRESQLSLSKAKHAMMQTEEENLQDFEKDVEMMTNKLKNTAKELHKQIDDWERSCCEQLTNARETRKQKQAEFITKVARLDTFDASLSHAIEKLSLQTADLKTSLQLIDIAKGLSAELHQYNPIKMLPVLEKEPALTTGMVQPQTKEYLTQESDFWKRVENIFEGRSNLNGPELAKMMVSGTRVVRGKDWKWEEQDGNGPGTVVRGLNDSRWIRVKWDNGNENGYRMGNEGCYDLQLV